jgi:hypothetical protein
VRWLLDGCNGRGGGIGGTLIAPPGEHVGDFGFGVRRHKIADPLHRGSIRTHGNIPHYAPGCVFHDVTFGDIDVNCLPLTNTTTNAVLGKFNCYIRSGTNGVMSLVNDKHEPTYPAKPGV